MSAPQPPPPLGKSHRVCWMLKPGYAHNPCLKIPRNSKCKCDSGYKFKDCCLPRLPRYVTEAQADEYKEHMKHPDFKFILFDPKRQLQEVNNAVEDSQDKLATEK